MVKDKKVGPFRFNPMWANHPEFLKIVVDSWSSLVTGSLFFVWEEKLRRLKKALKTWAKSIPSPNYKKTQAALVLEIHQTDPEDRIMDYIDIQMEIKLQLELHVACRQEYEWWRKNSRCKWLNDGDKNTSFFHKQAEARIFFNCVLEIQAHDRLINKFEDIKSEVTRHFSDLFTAQPITEDVELLNLVPRAIKNRDNDTLKHRGSRWMKSRRSSMVWRTIEL